jgi:hypothetical protein
MSNRKKTPSKLDEKAIDEIVAAAANDDTAWDPPVRVKRSHATSLSIPGDLAARAAFLARLHREPGVSEWVERVVRERVEIEEQAYSEAKRKLAS